MLLVPACPLGTDIRRAGLHAAVDIPPGTPVWRFTPGVDIDFAAAPALHDTAALRERLLHYGYLDGALGCYILCGDDARHIRASNTPSLHMSYQQHGIHGVVGVAIAKRHVAAGTALTLDYRAIAGAVAEHAVRPSPAPAMRQPRPSAMDAR
ncbi:MAG TPA: SET domain-containing protein [Lysobacter sp.]